jgi:hypothetical protein
MRAIAPHIAALSLIMLVAACAHNQRQSVTEAAREACEAEHVAAGAEMDACVVRTSESLQAAREYRADAPRQRPPGSTQRGGAPRS